MSWRSSSQDGEEEILADEKNVDRERESARPKGRYEDRDQVTEEPIDQEAQHAPPLPHSRKARVYLCGLHGVSLSEGKFFGRVS